MGATTLQRRQTHDGQPLTVTHQGLNVTGQRLNIIWRDQKSVLAVCDDFTCRTRSRRNRR